MTVLLWLSRHKPLPSQIDDLQKKIPNLDIVQHSSRIPTAEDAINLALAVKAEYVVPVLPQSFIMRLLEESKKHGITVLLAKMDKVHDCTKHPCPDFDPYTDVILKSRNGNSLLLRHYRFVQFEVLKKYEIVTEPF